jgi:hypothetical protein
MPLQSIFTGAPRFFRGHGGEEALNRALQSTSPLAPRFRGVAQEAEKESAGCAYLGATGPVAGGEISASSGCALSALNIPLQSIDWSARLFFVVRAGEVTEKQSAHFMATVAGADGESSASGGSARPALNMEPQSISTRSPPPFFVGCAGEEAERAELAVTATVAGGDRSASKPPPVNTERQSIRSVALSTAAPRLFIG